MFTLTIIELNFKDWLLLRNFCVILKGHYCIIYTESL